MKKSVTQSEETAADARVRACRVCGCTDARACLNAEGEACHWVALDLCSACAPVRSLSDPRIVVIMMEPGDLPTMKAALADAIYYARVEIRSLQPGIDPKDKRLIAEYEAGIRAYGSLFNRLFPRRNPIRIALSEARKRERAGRPEGRHAE